MKDNQNEQFIVVNKQDEVIGYKSRYECHHDKTIIHRVIFVALFTSKGNIVMQKRSKEKDLNPGYFTLSTSGHVAKGESYKSAAQRELKEEMGIQNVVLTRNSTFLIYDTMETEMATLFIGHHDGPFSFPKDEVQSIHYFSREEVRSCQLLTQGAITCLKQLKWV